MWFGLFFRCENRRGVLVYPYPPVAVLVDNGRKQRGRRKTTRSSVGRAVVLYTIGPWFESRRVDMKIRIKRFDKGIPLPEYKTKGAAAFDLSARMSVAIAPKTIAYIPLNVAIEPPEGHYVALFARSSLHKRGLMPANGVGVIDPDYSGDEDEYKAALYNLSEETVVIDRGERIMQAVIAPYTHAELEEVDHMGNGSRGGFGTTGRR